MSRHEEYIASAEKMLKEAVKPETPMLWVIAVSIMSNTMATLALATKDEDG